MIPNELRTHVIAGLSDQEIADKLGVSARTVLRWRKRAGLPSMWTPRLSPCGTLGSYARGCRCARCRAAKAAEQERTKQVYQALTKRALASYEPWTPQEDAVLLTGPGTVYERAQRLGRTWSACAQRLTLLRRQERITA